MPLLKSRWKLFAFKHHQISTKPSPRSEFINQKLKGISSPHPWFINRVFMNNGKVSAYLIIMKSKGSVPTKDKSAKKKRKKENSKYCLPVSILARPSDHKTRQMGKTFSLQTTQYCSQLGKQTIQPDPFKTKLFFLWKINLRQPSSNSTQLNDKYG